MSVVLAGGGTAGHIEPALALADALRRADPELGIVCLGTERGLETRLVPMRGYELALIPPVPMPRKLTPELMGVPGRLNASVAAAGRVLDQARARVLVGFGGYVATPAYLAARRRHVPIVVHEANARPGLANRIGARFTRYVYTGQPDTKLPHARYVGIPLRREIAGLDRLALADKARAHFGLRPDLPVLLVTGGSQGARTLNYAVLDAAEAIRGAGIQVLHILGPRSDIQVQMPPGGASYVTLPYLDRMDLAYAAADFALCRSGAMTCAELTAVGLPACYVPLPHGNGEQRLNALPVAAAGGGLIVADAELTPEWIRSDLLPILTDAQLVAAMSQAAAGIGHRDTDVQMATEILGLIRGGAGGGAGGGAAGGRAGRGQHGDGHRRRSGGRPAGEQAAGARYDDPRMPGGEYPSPGMPPGAGYETPGPYEDPGRAGAGYPAPGRYDDPGMPPGTGPAGPGRYDDPRQAAGEYEAGGRYDEPGQPDGWHEGPAGRGGQYDEPRAPGGGSRRAGGGRRRRA
jgi:UDP-N-acetylglucosamine--N-acetylmuramyl-(pentapeptide) pyrophosphoryl-undecaprenol N-acetylglucosamine transferase